MSGTSNSAFIPVVPHPAWAAGIKDIDENVARDELENWTEFSRWTIQMLKRGWPGSNGPVRGSTGGGATVVNIAPGAAGSAQMLDLGDPGFNAQFVPADILQSGVLTIEVGGYVTPLTLALGMTDCSIDIDTYDDTGGIVNAAIRTIPFKIAASAIGDIYPWNITFPLHVEADLAGVRGVGFTLNVFPASLQNVTAIGTVYSWVS